MEKNRAEMCFYLPKKKTYFKFSVIY